MADLLFGDLMRRPRRPRQFRGLVDIANFSDNELRARHRFGRQAIQYITDLLTDDLRRNISKLFLSCLVDIFPFLSDLGDFSLFKTDGVHCSYILPNWFFSFIGYAVREFITLKNFQIFFDFLC